jgi:hypothetical protein
MTDIRNVGQEVQAEILKTVRRGQESVRKSQETVRKGQDMVVGTIKTWSGTVRTKGPALPDLNLPFASKLPKPEELAASAYSFAMKLLADQRKFAEGVLSSTAQLRPGTSRPRARKATPRRDETARNRANADANGQAASKRGPATGQAASKQETAREQQAARGRRTAAKQEPAGPGRTAGTGRTASTGRTAGTTRTAGTGRTASTTRKTAASSRSATTRKPRTAK